MVIEDSFVLSRFMRDFRNPPTELAFDNEFRSALALEKYARWATDLTKDELLAVLWAIGEYGCRSKSILESLDRHKTELQLGEGFPRVYLALEVLAAMTQGNLYGAQEFINKMREVLAKWRSELGSP